MPRYERRLPEVNETVLATYLAGAKSRRLRGALRPLLKAAPLSKSAVSRVVGTLKAEVDAWRTRALADLDILGLYLDAVALRVRSTGKVVSVPALGVVAVLTDGQKPRLTLELGSGRRKRSVIAEMSMLMMGVFMALVALWLNEALRAYDEYVRRLPDLAKQAAKELAAKSPSLGEKLKPLIGEKQRDV